MQNLTENAHAKNPTSEHAIHIRHAIQADLPAIVSIYNQSVLTRQATADLTPVSVAEKQTWFDAHGMNQNRPMLVAINEHKTLLGWSTLSNLYERPAYHIAAEVSVYIDEIAKGQGLGQKLVQQQLQLAPTCGVRQVAAKIFAHNQPSLKLFKKLGFTEWGKLPQVCDMGDFIGDVVILGKRL